MKGNNIIPMSAESKHSKYKGVSRRPESYKNKKGFGRNGFWCAGYLMPNGKRWNASFQTEREAAIAYDLKMIELGNPPVNILKPKP